MKSPAGSPGKKKFNSTLFRVFPHVSNGAIEPMIVNPDAGSPEDMLGEWMVEVDMLDHCGDNNATILGGILTADSQGGKPGWLCNDGSIVQDWYSPLQTAVLALNSKIREAAALKQGRLPTGIPARWERWIDLDFFRCRCTFTTNLADPTYNGQENKRYSPIGMSVILIKGLLYVEDGVSLEEPVLAVMPVRRSSRTDFLNNCTTPHFPNKPVSEQNNKVGDFLSPEGYMLNLTAHQGSKKTEYSLSMSPEQLSLPESYIIQQHKSWDDILREATVENVIEALMESYGPEAVDFAFRGHRNYERFIPAEAVGASSGISDWRNTKETISEIAEGRHPLQKQQQQHQQQTYRAQVQLPGSTYNNVHAGPVDAYNADESLPDVTFEGEEYDIPFDNEPEPTHVAPPRVAPPAAPRVSPPAQPVAPSTTVAKPAFNAPSVPKPAGLPPPMAPKPGLPVVVPTAEQTEELKAALSRRNTASNKLDLKKFSEI
jgi:hypothetical protein